MKQIARAQARIGVLVPFTNTNLEADMNLLCPQGIAMHYARMGGYELDEIPDENQMSAMGAADLSEPLRLIAGVRPDVILYGCTSATLTHGPEFDRSLSEKIQHDFSIPSITAAGALIHALKAMQIKTAAFASPYVSNINKTAIDFLMRSGIDVVSSSDVDAELDNYGQGNLTPEQVCELARKADHEQAQAVVLSCTDMRAVETVNQLEAELNKPVITSNQALLYCALELIGCDTTAVNCGVLLKGDYH